MSEPEKGRQTLEPEILCEVKAALQKHEDLSLLLLEDDAVWRQRLARALDKRGFETVQAESLPAARAAILQKAPAFAVLDMRVGNENGLDFVPELQRKSPQCRIVMLTGYGNIATAVQAMKTGALDYLAKPADADQVAAALLGCTRRADLPETFISADRIKWEHIQRVYELCGRNVSETARRLSMHRRTLQRILAKRAPV